MKQELPALRVRMFDTGVKIYYGDAPVLYRKNCMTRAMRLLVLLLYSGEEGIGREALLNALYGSEGIADKGNNLRVTIHRLRKMLAEEGLPEYDYIIQENGVFRWNSPMETVVDARLFCSLLRQADMERDGERRFGLLREACELYVGEFLQNLSGEEWVLMESTRYRELYADTLQEVCARLKEERDYEEILRLAGTACELYPFDEWQAVIIDCYIAMNQPKKAFGEYKKMEKLYYEELGIGPSERMKELLKELHRDTDVREQMIGEIKTGLREEDGQEGAFYCSLNSFRDEYRLIRRIMERSGESNYLMLCTIVGDDGCPLEESDKLSGISDRLQESIQTCLRRCDSFTRYNPAQFLILLVGTSGENCRMISERIMRRFSIECPEYSQNLDFFVSSVADMEREEKIIPDFGPQSDPGI